MSGKVAKALRSKARGLATNTNLLLFGGRYEWQANSYRGIYKALKKVYKRTGRIAS